MLCCIVSEPCYSLLEGCFCINRESNWLYGDFKFRLVFCVWWLKSQFSSLSFCYAIMICFRCEWFEGRLRFLCIHAQNWRFLRPWLFPPKESIYILQPRDDLFFPLSANKAWFFLQFYPPCIYASLQLVARTHIHTSPTTHPLHLSHLWKTEKLISMQVVFLVFTIFQNLLFFFFFKHLQVAVSTFCPVF